MSSSYVSSDSIRARFSREMSLMYREEVPAYGSLIELVEIVNQNVLKANPSEHKRLQCLGELNRISEERHGAIRLGTAHELSIMRRLFAVMGMHPVGYYDLSTAGVPVHSTAFRPLKRSALGANPFRVFTSLLRLDLIEDEQLRDTAAKVLNSRQIFTSECLTLIKVAETQGGLTEEQAVAFVREALESFRWHSEAAVEHDVYRRLHKVHPLIADVVAFKGPHINHLTPRTLDIDQVQKLMPEWGITPKAVVEGPPSRKVPILLRQTSFKALEEQVSFRSGEGFVQGSHTARFGEIEQRGIALTPKGQALYDELLHETRLLVNPAADGSNVCEYMEKLSDVFTKFPDDLEVIRREGLGYFSYSVVDELLTKNMVEDDVDSLVARGFLRADPIIYEDFLPVSAAGIFQSNLGDNAVLNISGNPNLAQFERDLGASVQDLYQCYAQAQEESLSKARAILSSTAV